MDKRIVDRRKTRELSKEDKIREGVDKIIWEIYSDSIPDSLDLDYVRIIMEDKIKSEISYVEELENLNVVTLTGRKIVDVLSEVGENGLAYDKECLEGFMEYIAENEMVNWNSIVLDLFGEYKRYNS